MKKTKQLFKTCLASLLLVGAVAKSEAVTYTVDPGAPWIGYMNVFNVGGPGYGLAGAGGFVFGSGWGPSDLRATFSGPVLSLKANTIGDPDPFWYTPAGGPGAVGNKIMDANLYQQFDGPLAGQNVTFEGNVLANSLLGPADAAGRGWTAVAFIKDFAPDYSSSVATTVPLNSLGVFSISYTAINDPARHVQFGFEVIGPDVWAGDPLSVPSIDIVAVPEPTSLALAGMGAALLLIRRRK
jgi:hypothetical protein